ncbi:MAG TPA: HRDC domain-containing protein [Thermoanaerobaculia bacterium]|nr:HRDC domain-containing protein [Thermoanaerobaculia bacterium]
MSAPEQILTDDGRIRELGEALRRAGAFVIDLEFVSESRYVPEICLVQVAWGDPQAPELAALDPLAADPRPVLELVADPGVETVFHAAQGDLALLARRFGLAGRNVYDTQIAAAFLGLGDQIGYGGLVASLLGVELDKGAQFTDWCRRPLSAEQLRYAFDDVRYLAALWPLLRLRLEEAGRLGWVEVETERLAAAAATRPAPEAMFRRVKGWGALRGQALGALQALAAWREETALAGNKPPSWILQDRSLLEIARRAPAHERELAAIRGVKEGTIHLHGREILAAVRDGARRRPEAGPRERPLPDKARGWSVLLAGLVSARAKETGVAQRFLATRDDIEALVRWWLEGDRGREPDLPVLAGWRRELAGETLLAWLSGETTIAIDEASEAGIRLAEGG